MNRNVIVILAASFVILPFGCTKPTRPPGGPPAPVERTPPTLAIEAPEDDDAFSGPEPLWPAPPSPTRFLLPNGMAVALVTTPPPGSSIAFRLVFPGAGAASDGERPGTALLAAALIAEGWQRPSGSSLPAAPWLSSLETVTSLDATEIVGAVPAEALTEALSAIATRVRQPGFSLAAFERIRTTQRSQRVQAAATDDGWATAMVLHRELFQLPTSLHPYEFWGPTASDLEQVTLRDVQKFHTKSYTPNGATLVIAGSVNEAQVRAATRGWARWRGPEAPVVGGTDPLPPAATRVLVVDRPHASAAHVSLGVLLPAANGEGWNPAWLSALLTGESAGDASGAHSLRCLGDASRRRPSFTMSRVVRCRSFSKAERCRRKRRGWLPAGCRSLIALGSNRPRIANLSPPGARGRKRSRAATRHPTRSPRFWPASSVCSNPIASRRRSLSAPGLALAKCGGAG